MYDIIAFFKSKTNRPFFLAFFPLSIYFFQFFHPFCVTKLLVLDTWRQKLKPNMEGSYLTNVLHRLQGIQAVCLSFNILLA